MTRIYKDWKLLWLHLTQAQDYPGPVTGIHRLKVSPLVTNSLVTTWLSSVLSTSSVLYIYITSTFTFLKPSGGSSSSVLSQHRPSQIYTLSPSFPLSHNISLPPGLLGHPRSCFFPWSIHPSPSFPLTLNISLPPGLLVGHPRSLPESQLPIVPQHKPSPWTLPRVR